MRKIWYAVSVVCMFFLIGCSNRDPEIERYGCHLIGSYDFPFNQMSQDWGSDDVDGFVYHEISDKCLQAKGEFPVIMQVYSYILCNQNNVDYEILFALIEHLSYAQWDYINEDCIGYMQLKEYEQRERMERSYTNDILNPFMNVRVGILYLSDLYDEYKDWSLVLKRYSISEESVESVLERADELKQEKLKYQ